MISRRRLFQVLAVAPFAPWKEILEEAAKPKIFYSIPPLPKIYGFSPLDAAFFSVDQALEEYRLMTIAYAWGIPPEKLEKVDRRRITELIARNSPVVKVESVTVGGQPIRFFYEPEPQKVPRSFKYSLGGGNIPWTPRKT